MKTLTYTLGLVCAFGLVAGASAQDKKQPDPKEQEKAFEAYAKPGKEHTQLQRLVGRWDCEIKSFHSDPSKPTISKGASTFRSVLGGRFIQQQFRGKMEGQDFQGLGLSGYDNAQKKFVGTWCDSMGTGFMATSGTYDAKTQTLTETGSIASPMGEMKFKMVSKYLSDDKFTFTMFMIAEGEQKIMEITYTRAKVEPKKKKSVKIKD